MGGPIGLIKDGDIITLDIEARDLSVKLSDQELEKRKLDWSPPDPNYERGVLAKYAKLVSSASKGAVTS